MLLTITRTRACTHDIEYATITKNNFLYGFQRPLSKKASATASEATALSELDRLRAENRALKEENRRLREVHGQQVNP
jgi:cell shape-determining protein MreC